MMCILSEDVLLMLRIIIVTTHRGYLSVIKKFKHGKPPRRIVDYYMLIKADGGSLVADGRTWVFG